MAFGSVRSTRSRRLSPGRSPSPHSRSAALPRPRSASLSRSRPGSLPRSPPASLPRAANPSEVMFRNITLERSLLTTLSKHFFRSLRLCVDRPGHPWCPGCHLSFRHLGLVLIPAAPDRHDVNLYRSQDTGPRRRSFTWVWLFQSEAPGFVPQRGQTLRDHEVPAQEPCLEVTSASAGSFSPHSGYLPS